MEATERPFSDELEAWLESDGSKTVGALGEVFGEKSFAVTIMLLMFPSATPLPTGGITHVLDTVSALIALEMVLGLHTIWLPKRLRERELAGALTGKALPFVIRRVRWLERHFRRRWGRLFESRWFLRLLGLLILAFAIGSIVAPPFSGLDTLPAMGVVAIGLAIVLEDILLVAVGTVIGSGGLVLIATLGAAAARFFRDLF